MRAERKHSGTSDAVRFNIGDKNDCWVFALVLQDAIPQADMWPVFLWNDDDFSPNPTPVMTAGANIGEAISAAMYKRISERKLAGASPQPSSMGFTNLLQPTHAFWR